MSARHHRFGLLIVLLAGCAPEPSSGTAEIGLSFDESANRIDVTVTRELGPGESLHARARRGKTGTLDCARDASAIPRVDDKPVGGAVPTFAGPAVDAAAFVSPYDTSWLSQAQPTTEMLAR